MNALLSETWKKNELQGRETGEGKKIKKGKNLSPCFLFGSVARQQMGSQHPVVLAGPARTPHAASRALAHSQAGSGPLLPLRGLESTLLLSEAGRD